MRLVVLSYSDSKLEEATAAFAAGRWPGYTDLAPIEIDRDGAHSLAKSTRRILETGPFETAMPRWSDLDARTLSIFPADPDQVRSAGRGLHFASRSEDPMSAIRRARTICFVPFHFSHPPEKINGHELLVVCRTLEKAGQVNSHAELLFPTSPAWDHRSLGGPLDREAYPYLRELDVDRYIVQNSVSLNARLLDHAPSMTTLQSLLAIRGGGASGVSRAFPDADGSWIGSVAWDQFVTWLVRTGKSSEFRRDHSRPDEEYRGSLVSDFLPAADAFIETVCAENRDPDYFRRLARWRDLGIDAARPEIDAYFSAFLVRQEAFNATRPPIRRKVA